MPSLGVRSPCIKPNYKILLGSKCPLTSGETWGNVTWPVPPIPTGPGYEMARGGNPTVIFDSKRQNVVLHFNRGKKPILTS